MNDKMKALTTLLFFIQMTFIKQLGSIYGMLMTTFDPDEVPLMTAYLRNRQNFVDFANVEKIIKNTLLVETDNILSGLNIVDILFIFNYFYEQYFSFVVEIDERPITFKTFKIWFEKFKQENNDMTDIPAKHPMQIFFSTSNKHIESYVARALKQSHSNNIL